MDMSSTPMGVIERLHDAMNRHDLEAFLSCFATDYSSDLPLRPSRAFVGVDRVRKNWQPVFEGVPDLQAEIVRATVDGSIIWVETHWHGTWSDGGVYNMRGIMIMDIKDDQIAAGTLYVAPVET